MDEQLIALYEQLLTAWNNRDARAFASLFVEHGHSIGFDGSQADSANEIASHLGDVFSSHPTAKYVWKVRGVDALGPDAAVLRSVVGMILPDQQRLNPAVNSIQTLVARRESGRWRIVLLQTTPAQFHGRPDVAEALTAELSALVR
jgi:uncharacterized protein (TIGR02246 family)